MRRPPLLALLLLGFATPVLAVDLMHKSVSLSRQFIVYCDDANARARISDFADETKTNVLSVLGVPDQWKWPVVIQVERASAATPSMPASSVQLCQTEKGAKIALDVTLGSDPREIRFEQQVVRAVLIEFAFREHPPGAGASYAEPPAWLVEGVVELSHNRDAGTNAGLFKILLNNDHLPRLADFLAEESPMLDGESRRLYSACAMSLVQLLIELPDGHSSLAGLLRNLPRDSHDATGTLIKNFPALGATSQSMEKWWALSIARLSSGDRFQGLSLAETEQRLAALLVFDMPVGKDGETKKFTLDQFDEFRKLPARNTALTQVSSNLLALSTQASPLFRPVVTDYQQLASEFTRGKFHKVTERLAAAAKYRELVLTRMDQIEDYLNWFEATQSATQSDVFADYMKAARELANDATPRNDPISRYLDVVQQQTQ